jgi:hypothetical protein
MGITLRVLVLTLVGLVAFTGCSSDNNIFNRDEENLTIHVMSAANGVDFHIRAQGDCETDRPFVQPGQCTSQSWTAHPLENCTARLHCVNQFRVLKPGDDADARLPLYSSITTSGFGRATPMLPAESFEPGSTLEIAGCGDPILIELPAPLTPETIPEADADRDVIRITWDVDGAQSLHANTQSSNGFIAQYSATCHEAGDYVELPTLEEYPLSGVTLFALGAPERHTLDIGELTVYPAAGTAFGISWGPYLGDLSDFLGEVFEDSPSYEACLEYCKLREEHCGVTVAGADDCAGDCAPFGYPVSCIEELADDLTAAAQCDTSGAGGACASDATLQELCDQPQPYRACPIAL